MQLFFFLCRIFVKPNERPSLPAGLGYAYTCCSVPGMGGCEVQETDWAEGAGGTLEYLSDHHIACKQGEALRGFVLDSKAPAKRETWRKSVKIKEFMMVSRIPRSLSDREMEFWTWHSENLFVVFWQVPVSNPGRGEIRYMYVCCNVPMALPVSVSQRGSLSNSYEPWLSGKLSSKIQVGNAWQLCCVDISVLNIQGFLIMTVVWLDCPFLVVTIKKLIILFGQRFWFCLFWDHWFRKWMRVEISSDSSPVVVWKNKLFWLMFLECQTRTHLSTHSEKVKHRVHGIITEQIKLKIIALEINWQYIPLIYHLYIAYWVIIYHLPPIKGTRNSCWYVHMIPPAVFTSNPGSLGRWLLSLWQCWGTFNLQRGSCLWYHCGCKCPWKCLEIWYACWAMVCSRRPDGGGRWMEGRGSDFLGLSHQT